MSRLGKGLAQWPGMSAAIEDQVFVCKICRVAKDICLRLKVIMERET